MTSVVVGICTFRRPEMLARLLASIAACDASDLTIRAVVVDNDPAQSACPVVRSACDAGLEATYAPEPARGISCARNRLAKEALAHSPDYVIFVDDDEWVEREWLVKAVETAQTTGAASVAGPVVPVYDAGVPGWVERGGFFDRPRFSTGVRVRIANIGNVLVAARELVALMPTPFGTVFDSPGGEDTLFLQMLYQRGADTTWCDEAVVYEVVPRERASARWLIRRAFRSGGTYTVCLRALRRPKRTLALRAVTCVARAVQSVIAMPIAVISGRRDRVVSVAMLGAAGVGGLVELGRRS